MSHDHCFHFKHPMGPLTRVATRSIGHENSFGQPWAAVGSPQTTSGQPRAATGIGRTSTGRMSTGRMSTGRMSTRAAKRRRAGAQAQGAQVQPHARRRLRARDELDAPARSRAPYSSPLPGSPLRQPMLAIGVWAVLSKRFQSVWKHLCFVCSAWCSLLARIWPHRTVIVPSIERCKQL